MLVALAWLIALRGDMAQLLKLCVVREMSCVGSISLVDSSNRRYGPFLTLCVVREVSCVGSISLVNSSDMAQLLKLCVVREVVREVSCVGSISLVDSSNRRYGPIIEIMCSKVVYHMIL